MTEVEVMADLLFCQKGDCAHCPRVGENCKSELLRDARSVIKLQLDALNEGTEAIGRLREENERYRQIVKHSYEKKKLVEAVNNIIGACAEEADCPDCGGDFRLENMVNSLNDFLNLIGWENCLIQFCKNRYYPDILWHE